MKLSISVITSQIIAFLVTVMILQQVVEAGQQTHLVKQDYGAAIALDSKIKAAAVACIEAQDSITPDKGAKITACDEAVEEAMMMGATLADIKRSIAITRAEKN